MKKTKRLKQAEKVLFATAQMYYGNRIEPDAEEEMHAACREYFLALHKIKDSKPNPFFIQAKKNNVP